MNELAVAILSVFFAASSLVQTSLARPSLDLAVSLDQYNGRLPVAADKADKTDKAAPIKKKNLSRGVKIKAQSVLIMDGETSRVLYSKNAGKILPLASVTKLATVLVLWDLIKDWKQPLEIIKADRKNTNKPNFGEGDKLTLESLLEIALISSDNDAVSALVRATGLEEEAFILKMNEKAMALGMNSSRFVDATGLSPENKSNATDVLKLLKVAVVNPKIRQATTRPRYFVQSRKTPHYVYNTNLLLHSFLNQKPYQVVAGKTGFIEESGYNLALSVKGDKANVLAVILGGRTSADRFQELKNLIHWTFNNFQWPKVGVSASTP